MGGVCLQCGDIGWDRQLVYCIKCLDSAIHRYCMDVMPEKDEVIHWICEECLEAESSNSPSWRKSRKRGQEVLESNEEISTKKPKKNQTEYKSDSIQKNIFLYSFAGFDGLRSVESDISPEPLIRSIWTGNFNVWYKNESISRKIGGFSAYLSRKACRKVCKEAAMFQPELQHEMLSKSQVWPKSFQGSGPTGDNVAVYFFPSLMEYERFYDYLVFDMIRDNLAMRAFVQNAELLIFTSVELPSRFWRFQGKLYLWGVFREKMQG